MDTDKSLDEVEIIAALIYDVYQRHGLVSNTRILNLTLKKVKSRTRTEGLGFLTKTLPRLAKAFDKALAGETPLNSSRLGFKTQESSELPKLFGELFNRVLSKDGTLLQHPDATCVKSIRELCYLFYKYELLYTDEQEQQVLSQFEETEKDLDIIANDLDQLGQVVTANHPIPRRPRKGRFRGRKALDREEVTRAARHLLEVLFLQFDPRDIKPKHGPGAVATKQKLWDKFKFTNVSHRITSVYPLDEYYFSSLGHVCDRLSELSQITDRDLPARVILVPKDSRGPRLISCEPVDFQWIQQGLARAVMSHVENDPLTRFNVFFTDQGPNQRGAHLGAKTGKYATLDLKEASDRVSLSLVRLLFPVDLVTHLEACRSTSTELPDGRIIPLNKFAPMGSSLCFPIMALTIWAILTAAAPDADTEDGILVYGDDVVVPTAYAEDAMKHLESFGLKINHDKSCTKGLFRESCGHDSFQGINVTPVRLRTVWAHHRSPEVYSSWVSFAGHLADRSYHRTYDLVVSKLLSIYGEVPSEDIVGKTCPSLRWVPERNLPKRRRWNKDLQKIQHSVWCLEDKPITHEMDGWLMLLRFFTSSYSTDPASIGHQPHGEKIKWEQSHSSPFSVRQYTRRKSSMLVKRWR